MSHARLIVAGLVAAALFPARARAAQPPAPTPRPAAVSARNASYTIGVTFDPASGRISGRARLHWRNVSNHATRELLLNLFDDSTPGSSSIVVSRAVLGGTSIDLLPSATYARSDDGGPADRSVIRLALPSAVAPGSSLDVDVEWTGAMPGDRGTMVVLAHWFPHVAVLADGGWVTRRSSDAGDRLSDYGAYDVTISAPAGWQIAATGHEERPAADARAGARRFVQTDVRDFAWALGRNIVERRVRVERDGALPVDVRIWLQPDHERQADRIMTAVSEALTQASPLSPYDYSNLTVIDVPWRSAFTGLTCPTLLTLTLHWWQPALDTAPDAAIARGIAGHFWQQAINSDARDQTWIVNGVSAYAAARLVDAVVRRHLESTSGRPFLVTRLFGGFAPYVMRAVRVDPALADDESGDYRRLSTLDRYLGRSAFESILVEYIERFRFGHPVPEDFLRTVETAAGRDLHWLFDQMAARQRVFDYGVERVTEDESQGRRRTSVVVERYGDAVFSGDSRPRIGPYESGRAIEVEVTFADGTVRNEHWDGREHATAFVYDSIPAVTAVVVDPRHTLAMETRRTNNSWTRTPQAATASARWAARWMVWLEDLVLGYASFV